MKPVLWGILAAVIGLVGWVVFVVLSVITGGAFRIMANLFGWIGLLSIPASFLFKFLLRKKKK